MDASPLRESQDDILLDFAASASQVGSGGDGGRACCEGVGQSFVLHMIYVLRVIVAIVVATTLLSLAPVERVLPRGTLFLVLLSAILSVRPLWGMALVQGCYSLPLYAATQFVATGVALVMPVHPALVSFLIVLGVFAISWLDLPPVVPKIMASIWLITLVNRQQLPLADPVPPAFGLVAGLCLAQCAVLIAQLLPPFTVKRLVDQRLAEAASALAELVDMAAKEFGRGNARIKQTQRRLQRDMLSSHSVPLKISSTPEFLQSFLQSALGGLHHKTSRVERADALQDKVQAFLALAPMAEFVQAERPLGDVANYGRVSQLLQDALLRVQEARAAIPTLDQGSESPMSAYRVEIGEGAVRSELVRGMRQVLAVLGESARDPTQLAALGAAQEELKLAMERARATVEAARLRHFGSRDLFHPDRRHALPVAAAMATHVMMTNFWNLSRMLSTFSLGPRFVPFSLAAVLAAVRLPVDMWATRQAPPAGYAGSAAFRTRLVSAFVASACVALSLPFVFVPELREVFSVGIWVSLTALFVYTPSSGATLRAARDRLLGIFLGTSYAFICLIVLRYTSPSPLQGNSPVAIAVFVSVFVALTLVLLQDSLGLAFAAIYAVVLMLFSLPPQVSAQSALVLANFLNTFIGAALVTLVSSYGLFRSSRAELGATLEGLCRSAHEALHAVGRRITDYDVDGPAALAAAPQLSKRILGLAAASARLEQLIQDAVSEPTLWRAPFDAQAWTYVVVLTRTLMQELYWLETGSRGFLLDPAETTSSGILATEALPDLMALTQEAADALLEIGELLHYARHPARKFKLLWRPAAVSVAQRKCNKDAWLNGMSNTHFATGRSEHMSALAVLTAFSATCFAIDRLATTARELWTCVFAIAASQRRRSLRHWMRK